VPRVIVTDKLRSYGVARRHLLPNVEHRQSRYNNRVENSHRPTRRRERQMQRFKSSEQARRFSPLMHSYTATSIHVDTKWQPRPTARSGLMHSTTGGGRHVPGDEMMRASQPCGVPRRLNWINVTMPRELLGDFDQSFPGV
jgi:hypothetical protein